MNIHPSLVPARIAALPKDQRGYPVPWFVAVVNGAFDFRVMDAEKLIRAVKERRCWVCGEPLGRHLAFVIGPMCAINRISAEPPSHADCAVFSAMACPFLSNPEAPRRETAKPEGVTNDPAHIARNPGATLVWVTESYKVLKPDPERLLFEVGPPERTEWFARGRAATRAEVLASIDSGFPLLLASAQAEGSEAVEELERRKAEALKLLPAV